MNNKRITEEWMMLYPDDQIQEPIICTIARKFDIVVSVRESRVIPIEEKKLRNIDYGAFVEIDVVGEKANLEEAKKFLEKKGVKCEAHRI